MAKIEDLIAQIPDDKLRKAIADEVKALKKTKKFGLVFEEHLPETVRLPRLPVRAGELVALKRETGNQLWRVTKIDGDQAICEQAIEGYTKPDQRGQTFLVRDLVVVRNFGDPIYPALIPVDRVTRGGPDKPWHSLINADNFHALQLLLYAYAGQVDVIYIDPPYNTGARDWKYNNDYVDKADTFRHSKWLSMMKKRLLLAKRLLKPDGVMIVAIDDNELAHLGSLLEEIFVAFERFIVTIEHNRRGRRGKNFAKSNEWAIFLVPKNKEVIQEERTETEIGGETRNLRRTGSGSLRKERFKKFYPIWINEKTLQIERIDDFIPKDADWERSQDGDLISIWPIDDEGREKNWHYAAPRARKELASGKLFARRQSNGIHVYYTLRPKESKKYKTVWYKPSLDASTHGSELLDAILGSHAAFDFPKSIYAVVDCLKAACAHKPDALVLDFFGGSGTTLHALMLLNASFGGQRRGILVTNNEARSVEADEMLVKGLVPGDAEYEAKGVCDSVTWPRCKYVINGKRDDGQFLEGNYLTSQSMSSGFEENLEYFRLDFLDPAAVARGDAFQAILPILWLMAGAQGEREDSKGSQAWFIPKHSPFAVLIQERRFRDFAARLAERPDITHVFLVTDSEENFGVMRRALAQTKRDYRCVQLYKSYLENFRLNTQATAGAVGVGGTAG